MHSSATQTTITPPRPPEPTDGGQRWYGRPGAVAALFAAAGAVAWLVSIPQAQSFDNFAFSDAGSELMLPRLSHALGAPTIGYGYMYGILSHWLSMLWFDVAGATPRSLLWMGLPLTVAFYWALGRAVRDLDLGTEGALWVLALAPMVGGPPYAGPQHALEPVCLIAALRAHAKGRYAQALTACVLAALFRPSMGYVYGALLLALLWRRAATPQDFFKTLRWPAATAAVLLTAAMGIYPPRAVVNMLAPYRSALTYRATGLGWLGSEGRQFWDPAGKTHLAYYVGTPVAAWTAMTTVLLALAVWALRRGRGELRDDRRTVIVTAAVLYAFAIVFMYGSAGSWSYYSFFPVLALACLVKVNRGWARGALAGLVLLAWLGDFSSLRATRNALRTPARAEMGGLHAGDEEAREWQQVVARAQREPVLVYSPVGDAAATNPAMESPLRWMLLPYTMRPAESAADERQIAAVGTIVIPAQAWPAMLPPWNDFPPAATIARDFTVLQSGRYFLTLARMR